VADPPVIAFLSTGRCGTQWLAAGLREFHPKLEVEHEPIGPLYKPRLYFRRYADPEAVLEVPEAAKHVERIESTRRPYVETGWPLFPVLPLLAERLPGRLRIVHLTRHPAPSALSHVAHSSYAGSPRDDAYTRWATLGPGDRRVFQPGYRHCWDRITPYEKCLFWWTEVHQFGLELSRRIDGVPLLRVQSEKLLAGDRSELERLLSFMDLTWHDGWLEHAGRLVDRWHHHTDEAVDPLVIRRHRWTLEVAHQLGYDGEALDVSALEARYLGAPDPGLDRVGRYEVPSSSS
jgi:hypothetical protein